MGLRTIMALVIILALLVPASAKKVYPATPDSVPAENRMADSLGLRRYLTSDDVSRGVEAGELVALTVPVSAKIPKWRRYARPETVDFVARLDAEFYAATRRHILVDSAVRPEEVQRKLCRHNRSAAPASGSRASSHERGTTVDLSRRMRRRDYRWLLVRLGYYRALGQILIIEERHCVHIFVGSPGVAAETNNV